ncbi:MAG: GIY-YIG nuclease family protein [Planctomycetota bacterium]
MWYLYIIPKNNKYYTGITTDLNNRLRHAPNSPR